MISNFFAPLAVKVLGGLSLALAIALAVVMFRADAISAERDALQRDLDNVKAAQVVAAQAAQVAKERAEQDYRNLAETSDAQLEQARLGAMDAAERYIAAHRVRSQAVDRPASGTTATPDDYGAEIGDGPGPASLVVVTPDDIRICTENTIRLEAVQEWATALTN